MNFIELLLILLTLEVPIQKPQDSPLVPFEQQSVECEKVEIFNLSDENWNNDDDNNLSIAKNRCSQLYLDSPCLKKFIKKKKLTYNAICGSK